MPYTVDIVSDVQPEHMLEAAVTATLLLPPGILPVTREGFLFLRYVDPDHDTYFNRWQMEPFLSEWDRLEQVLANRGQRDVWQAVRDLAIKVRDQAELDLFLRVSGN